MSKLKVMFISSSGGHLTQILNLSPLFDIYDSYLITEYDISTSSIRYDKLKVSYFPETRKNNIFKYVINNIRTMVLTIKYFFLINPDIIISTGAGISVYMCYLAKLFKKKIIFFETFAAIKGKSSAGRLIYPIADRFYIQWESMKDYYPKAIFKGTLY